MSKDSTFFLFPQGNNKASTEQKLCSYKYCATDNQDFYIWWMPEHHDEFSTEQTGSQVPKQQYNIRLLFKIKHSNLKKDTRSSTNPSVGNTSCCCFYDTYL